MTKQNTKKNKQTKTNKKQNKDTTKQNALIAHEKNRQTNKQHIQTIQSSQAIDQPIGNQSINPVNHKILEDIVCFFISSSVP